jgi:Leucine-rich repeat (LRR) protein
MNNFAGRKSRAEQDWDTAEKGRRNHFYKFRVPFSLFESLDLKGTQVSDRGLTHLRGLTKLDYLDLDGTQVTDAGLEYLKDLTALDRVFLRKTRVTDDGTKKVKQARPSLEVSR